MMNVGVIGVGAMGQHHVRIFSSMDGVNLVGVADIDKERAEKLAAKYKVRTYSDHRKLFEQDLDAVSIVAPTSLHEGIALSAFEYECNVLVEKPIAHTIESAKRIIAGAKRCGAKLMVGHIERFNPIIPVIMKEIEDNNVILLEITRVGPFPPRIKDVGVVVDLAIHDIDLSRYLSNCEPKAIRSVVSTSLSDKEDSAILLFEMENGTIARLTTNWLTPFKVRRITIATESKFIEGDFITQTVTEYSRYSEDGSYITRTVSVPYAEPLRAELEAFIGAIKNDTIPPITGEDGLRALEIALTALKLAHKGRDAG